MSRAHEYFALGVDLASVAEDVVPAVAAWYQPERPTGPQAASVPNHFSSFEVVGVYREEDEVGPGTRLQRDMTLRPDGRDGRTDHLAAQWDSVRRSC